MIEVLNTRPSDQAGALTQRLKEAGFGCHELPLVEIKPVAEMETPVASLNPEDFQGLLFSSPNGVRHFLRLLSPGLRNAWFSLPVSLVGPGAIPEVEKAGGRVHFLPVRASLGGLLEELPPPLLPEKWLHPCSQATRLDPADFLSKGITAVNLPVYYPALPSDTAERLQKVWPRLGAVVFCSGSAVENLFAAAPALAAHLGRTNGPVAVSIGESTTAALLRHDVTAPLQARRSDNAGLVEILREAYFKDIE